jgi:hypothetical protein
MTDELDELMELTPTHASALLIDPVDLAERAGRSARSARRRANVFTGLTAAAALIVVVALAAVFLRPVQAVPGASPSPAFPGPSSTPMSSFVPMYAGDEAAAYTAPRLAYGLLTGTDRPDQLCIRNSRGSDQSVCAATVPVTGLTWSQVPWQAPGATGDTASDAFVWGYFDGTSLRATAVSRGQDTTVSFGNPQPSPAAPTGALITCDRTIVGSTTPSGASTPDVATTTPSRAPTYGSILDPAVADSAGLDAYWIEYSTPIRLLVATSGDLDAAALKVPTFWNGPTCIGRVPAQGPLADLLAAQKRVRDAKIDGVTSAAVATYPAGVLQVNVLANVPGLRERVVAVVGTSVSLTIVPLLVTVHNEQSTPSASRS